MSKLDGLRAMRERNFEERAKRHAGQVSPSASSPEIIYGGGRGGGMSEVVNNTKQALLTSSAKRQAEWRKANPELNRQRAREGMRKLRAGVA